MVTELRTFLESAAQGTPWAENAVGVVSPYLPFVLGTLAAITILMMGHVLRKDGRREVIRTASQSRGRADAAELRDLRRGR